MPIQRSGPVPPFYEYVIKKALVPHHHTNTQTITNLGIHDWVEIPRYQRGISWEIDNVEEFLNSPSILLGNVILAQFPHSNQFPNLTSNNYLILVDGLQRFSVGTMILSILHDKVFATGAPFHSSHQQYFASIMANVFAFSPVYIHNDLELCNHPRNAINTQYKALKEKIEIYIQQKLNSSAGIDLAQAIHSTFLNRQVALDTYFNFNGPIEIMNTFLGINTVRVDLGPVDLLRALIIEQGATAGWSAVEIDEVENEFTGIFTTNDRPDTSLLPFVNVILKSLNNHPKRVFPSWGMNLQIDEVNDFLEFVEAFKNPTQYNGYLQEIKECGSIPFAILISYYYMSFVHHGTSRPSFLTGGAQENDELKDLLTASYRVLIDGTIGRTRTYAEKIIEGTANATLTEIADGISSQFINCSIHNNVSKDWLISSLNKVDKTKAKRIFNAMLLADRGNSNSFSPLIFGRSSTNFHIDHLIPQSLLGNALTDEGETIKNFAPLPQNQNRQAKATSCSSKLAPTGTYQNYLNGNSHVSHPYCEWLVNEYNNHNDPSKFDLVELLEPNTNPAIGTSRIQYISNYLLNKI